MLICVRLCAGRIAKLIEGIYEVTALRAHAWRRLISGRFILSNTMLLNSFMKHID